MKTIMSGGESDRGNSRAFSTNSKCFNGTLSLPAAAQYLSERLGKEVTVEEIQGRSDIISSSTDPITYSREELDRFANKYLDHRRKRRD